MIYLIKIYPSCNITNFISVIQISDLSFLAFYRRQPSRLLKKLYFMVSYTGLKGSICSSADTPEFQLKRGVTMYMYIQGYVFICILFTYM